MNRTEPEKIKGQCSAKDASHKFRELPHDGDAVRFMGGPVFDFAVSFVGYQQIHRAKAERCNLERFRVKLLPIVGVLACL